LLRLEALERDFATGIFVAAVIEPSLCERLNLPWIGLEGEGEEKTDAPASASRLQN